jgi:DeoR family glycerol-3-phosphate regulon repressor
MSAPAVRRSPPAEARHDELLSLVRERGYVSIEAMAARLCVSAQTVRRDIRYLHDRGLLERHHGGAGLPPGEDLLAYSSRRVRNAAEKRAIGELVARQVPNATSLFIDIGTTTEAVANALVGHQDLSVVTNHVAVALILSERTDFDVILAGGTVRKRDQAVTGPAAADFVQRFKVAYGIFGIGSIDGNGELFDYAYRDLAVSRAAMENSRRRFLVMDHGKFDGDAMVSVGDVAQVDALFTSARPPDALRRTLRDHGVQLHVAGG